MGKEYAVMGAKLECNQGSAPSNLVVLPRRIQVNDIKKNSCPFFFF